MIRRKPKPGGRISRKIPKKRPQRQISGKNGGIKPWSLDRADTMFRLYALSKLPHRCVFPNCPITDPSKLTVSHYFGRAKKGTRYDLENCDLLCRNHHYWDKTVGWEFQKQRKEDPRAPWDGRYTLYMKEKLGEDGFKQLCERAELPLKQKIAIQDFRTIYEAK